MIARLPSSIFARLAAAVLFVFATMGVSVPALADVQVSFHSFNGSVLWGRYPHTFVVFDGTLDDGTRVDANYGFSARYSAEAISSGPAEHMIITETDRTIADTNLHFTMTISDRQYRRLLAEVIAWRDYPGDYYDLDSNNCIHFVARLAELVGLEADVPEEYLRRPKAWLNYVTRNNPELGGREIP